MLKLRCSKKSEVLKVITAIIALSFAVSILMSSTIPVYRAATSVSQQAAYGDIMQYDWPWFSNGPSNTHFGPGPAPDTADILWKASIPFALPSLLAFDGKIFAHSLEAVGKVVYAMDAFTGKILWSTNVGPMPTAYLAGMTSIPPDYLLVGIGPNGVSCLDAHTGKILWTVPGMHIEIGGRAIYSENEKMLFAPKYAGTVNASDPDDVQLSTSQYGIRAWNLSDPSKPPTLVWECPIEAIPTADHEFGYGDGKVFTSFPSGFEVAINASTGKLIWKTPVTGTRMHGGCYYEGKWLHGGADGSFYALDANTGEILWEYFPGTFYSHWSRGPAAAYGTVYETNLDGYLYALNATTGKLIWKYGGAYENPPKAGSVVSSTPGYPTVADGKVYCWIGSASAKNQVTGIYSKDEWVCLDAYTGKLIFTMPTAMQLGECISAYGNIYTIPCVSVLPYWVVNTGEVWCIGGKPKDWSMFRGNPAHTAQGFGPSDIALKWKFKTGGTVVSSPTIVDGVVYVGSGDKNVYAIDAYTGNQIWKFETGYAIRSSQAVVSGKVYTGADDGNIYCLDAKNGEEIWKTPAGGISMHQVGQGLAILRSSPIVVDDKVYVGSLDGNLYCLNAETGAIIWKFASGGPIMATPSVIENDGIYFTSTTPIVSKEDCNMTLYKLSTTTGDVIWKLGIPRSGFIERGEVYDVLPSPTVADGMVFLPDDWYYRCYCVNATTGIVKWAYRLYTVDSDFSVASILYVNGKVYVPDFFALTCLDAATGAKIWSTWLDREVYNSPTYSMGRIYIGSNEGSFRLLDATNGTRLSYYNHGASIWSSPSLYDGKLYWGAFDWNIYCFEQADLNLSTAYTTMTASVSKNQINLSESVSVAGNTNPILANTPITVSFIKPDQMTVDIVTESDANGFFTASYKPEVVGQWNVVASFEGKQGWAKAQADVISMTVLSPTQTPTETPTTDNTMTYMYVAVAVIVIVVIAAAALILTRRKK